MCDNVLVFLIDGPLIQEWLVIHKVIHNSRRKSELLFLNSYRSQVKITICSEFSK